MNPAHLLSVYQVEVERLFLRATAIIGLCMAAFFGLLGPILIFLTNWAMVANGVVPDPATVDPSVPDAMAGMGPTLATWQQAVSLGFSSRNFFFVPILIFLLGGLSLASEFRARTTREDVLRPLARWQLLGCKWGALLTWVLAANIITLVLSAGLGLILAGGLEFDDSVFTPDAGVQAYWDYIWSGLGAAIFHFSSTFVMDLGFATLALAIAVLTRSVAATVAGLVMLFVVQLFTAFGLLVLTSEPFEMAVKQVQWVPVEAAEQALAWADFLWLWQPPFVIGCVVYEQPWQGYVTLAVITVVSLIVAVARFETMDVP